MMQVIAIVIVFLSASYEYFSEIRADSKKAQHQGVIQVPDTEERI